MTAPDDERSQSTPPRDPIDRISVCMATFNGAAWVEAQMRSILAQLAADDEVIVVDDDSADDTIGVLERMRDPRVRLSKNPHNLGYVRSFERALDLAEGDVVFLADQDDVWPEGRVRAMCAALERGLVVAGNVSVLDGPARTPGPFGERDWRLTARSSGHTLRNLGRLALSDMPYFGSAMALRREALDLALPFPPAVRELHDAWLALIGLASRSIVHLDERVVLRRIHAGNTSGQVRDPLSVVRGRAYFVGMCVVAWARVARARGRRRRLARFRSAGGQ